MVKPSISSNFIFWIFLTSAARSLASLITFSASARFASDFPLPGS